MVGGKVMGILGTHTLALRTLYAPTAQVLTLVDARTVSQEMEVLSAMVMLNASITYDIHF